MKKNGFTLVELLGVITILAMLGMIAVPVINHVISSNKESLYDTQIRNIKMSASNFVSENVMSINIDKNESIGITLGRLKELGFVDKDIKNPISKEKFSDNLVIIITNTDLGYEYTVCDGDVVCDNNVTLY